MPKKSAPATGQPTPELSGSIWFRSGGQDWGSRKRMALLEAIDQEGSITAAAKKVGLSYKGAWDAVDTMNNVAGEPLVQSSTGGQRGGGATLTARAKALLASYRVLHTEHERFMSRLAAASRTAPGNLELIQYMMIQTSARNKLAGTVLHIKKGAVNDEITLQLDDDTAIVASISSESTIDLGLLVGKRALAFIKASSVIVGLPGGDTRLSARNQLPGRLVRIVEGAVNTEVSIQLPGGQILAAMLSRDSAISLQLREEAQVYAIFKASSVILGVLD